MNEENRYEQGKDGLDGERDVNFVLRRDPDDLPPAPTDRDCGCRPVPPAPPAPPACEENRTCDSTFHPGSASGAPLPADAGSHRTAETDCPPQPEAADPNAGKAKKRKTPGWSALVGAVAVAALLGGALGVGVMTLRYDGTRPAGIAEPAGPTVAPVVKSSPSAAANWQTVAKTVGPSVVAISTESNRGAAQGSGVIIDAKGHILTNNHVIAGAKEIMVTLSDGRLYEAKLVGTDAATDLAVIRLKNPPKNLTVAALGNSSDLRVGQPVAAIGNPLGLSFTVTTGIVSALDRPVQTVNQEARSMADARVVTNAVQIDAAVNPGNSGGPVFDAGGRVIGIASSIATISSAEGKQGGSIGLGFAIPINLAKHVAEQLIAKGVAEHAYLGVTVSNGVAEYGNNSRLGATVESIQPDTPAARARLRRGDVITAVNGRSVVSGVSLTGYIRQYRSGEKVTLTIARNGELQELDVTLATKVDDSRG